ncbi:MAG: prolipoprotein diacylglyceryl transferase [Anaerolineaceae bacterium]|nr:prolipoprotein diacylglyceryl transferase [Anaerolineaceae bacterium]
MFPVINLGPLAIQSFGLILLISIWAGLSWSEKHAARHNIQADLIFTIFFLVVVASFLGARIGYVLLHVELFSAQWLDGLALNLRMMDWPTGILIGGLTLLIYLQRKKIPLWNYLDSMIPFFLVFNAAFALATFANQTAIGAETQLPWGMLIYEKIRHPVQVYHMIIAAALILIYWPNRMKVLGISLTDMKPGGLFNHFLILYTMGITIVQTFRAEYPVVFTRINSYHFIGLFVLIFALWQSYQRIRFVGEND